MISSSSRQEEHSQCNIIHTSGEWNHFTWFSIAMKGTGPYVKMNSLQLFMKDQLNIEEDNKY